MEQEDIHSLEVSQEDFKMDYQEALEGFKEGQEGPSGEQEDTRLA